MVEKEKTTWKDGVGCLGIIVIVAAMGYGGYWGYEKINTQRINSTKIEQGILEKSGLLGTHTLVPLNQAGRDFKDMTGYFKYFDTKDTQGKKLSMVEFAWERADGEIEVSNFTLNKTTAVLDDQASEVDFNLQAKDCLTDELFPHAIKSVDPNDYVSRSESITFSLPQPDFNNFKGPK